MIAHRRREVKPKLQLKEKAMKAVTGLYAHVAQRFPHAYILVATRKKKATEIYTKQAVSLENFGEYLASHRFSTEVDYYLTQNLYKGGFRQSVLHWRKQENLLSLANIVIDVDMHADEDTVSGVRHRRERLRVFEDEIGRRLARITNGKLDYTCVFTGRGLQFWFPLEPTAYACRWMIDSLTQALLGEFKAKLSLDSDPYGFYNDIEVDASASARLSGLFRFPFTQNTKGGRSDILHICQKKPCHPKELLELFDILPEGSYKPKKPVKKSRKGSKPKGKRGTRAPRYVPLMMNRKDFLETIVPNIKVGRRTLCLYTYASTVRRLFDDKKEAEKAIRRYNACYSVPLPKSAVDAILHGELYKFRKFKFLSIMEASDMEYEQWKKNYIPKWKRERIASHEAFRAKMEAKWDAIVKMRGQGKSYRAISRALNVSFSTIQRILGQQKAAEMEAQKVKEVQPPKQARRFKLRRKPAEFQKVAKPLAESVPVQEAPHIVPLKPFECEILDLFAKEYLATYHLSPIAMQAFTSRGFASVEAYLHSRRRG